MISSGGKHLHDFVLFKDISYKLIDFIIYFIMIIDIDYHETHKSTEVSWWSFEEKWQTSRTVG